MSGHSKWSTIKHQKASADAKRSKLFSRLAKEIAIAAREGNSGDIDTNSRLRLAVSKARAANMPKDNIDKAIKRGMGVEKGISWEKVTYEGFGPDNIAVIVECITDNKNRALQEIKTFFDKRGGRLGSSGAVSYLFDKKGKIEVAKKVDEDEDMLSLIDCGIDDIVKTKKGYLVYVSWEKLHQVTAEIEKQGFVVEESALVWKPKIIKANSGKKSKKIEDFLSKLDELDDVQAIFSDYS